MRCPPDHHYQDGQLSGQNKAGFCSICAHPNAREINAKIKSGWKAPQVIEFAKSKFDFEFHRQTLYSHREHVEAGKAVIQAAEKVRALEIRKAASNENFLEAIRDIAFSRAIDDPDSVTIEQGLKAVSILESKKDRRSDGLAVLIAVMTGQAPPATIIEGVAQEI